jgi:hypothetical protein
MRIDTNHKRNKELINYYLTPHSLRETSEKFQISFQRVSQILNQYKIKTHKTNYELIIQENKELSP